MNLLAATTTPAQSAPAYQNTTLQPDRPAPKPSLAAKAFVYGNWFFNIVIVVFIVLMIFRFVRSFEKIANGIEKGIVIRKDDKTT
jgi:hypothetical protein